MTEGRFSSLEFDDRGGARRRAEARAFVEERDAAWYLRQAEAQELAGEPEAALRSFSAALGEDPLLLEGWLGQARMLVQLEEYPEARLWADKALEKFPDHPQLLAVKSLAMHRMGLHRDARTLNDVALGSKGESAVVWLCRGELMLDDSLAAAEQCFEHARRLAEPKGPMLLRVGAAYLRHGHYSLAMAALQEAASAVPKAAQAWYLLGLAQRQLGLVAQARVSFAEAHKLAPRSKAFRDAAANPSGGLGAAVRGFLRRVFGR